MCGRRFLTRCLSGRCCTQSTDVLAVVMRLCVLLLLLNVSHGFGRLLEPPSITTTDGEIIGTTVSVNVPSDTNHNCTFAIPFHRICMQN